jgi:hypothetical protein
MEIIVFCGNHWLLWKSKEIKDYNGKSLVAMGVTGSYGKSLVAITVNGCSVV